METAKTTYYSFIRNQNWKERLVLSKMFWVCFIAIMFSYPIYKSLNRTLPPPLPILYTVPDFTLTRETGEAFGSKDLRGKVYLANFVFTSCPTSCPKQMKTMEKVAIRMKGVGTHVAIATITVDPTHDTPEVLNKFARKYNANPFVWNFLTGKETEIQKLVTDGYKLPLAKGDELMSIAHSNKIVLVDFDGKVRGYYDSEDEESINQLMIDVGLIINRKLYGKI